MQKRRWKYDIKINPMKVFSDEIDARQCIAEGCVMEMMNSGKKQES